MEKAEKFVQRKKQLQRRITEEKISGTISPSRVHLSGCDRKEVTFCVNTQGGSKTQQENEDSSTEKREWEHFLPENWPIDEHSGWVQRFKEDKTESD